MKSKFLLTTLAAGSLLALGAPGVFAQSTTTAPAPSAKKETAKMKSAEAGGFTAADKKLIKTAAESDENEISLAKIALQKSSNAEVKTYAQQMVTDHTKSTTMLKPIADAAGVPKPDIKVKHKAVAARLETLSGDKFDKEYVEANVKSHQETANKMKAMAGQITNPELKSFATTVMPIVEHHLMMAQEMNAKMGGDSAKKKKTASM